ncbi:MAG: glycerol-3-phosphate acyltransferase PlsY [Planctomycetota bacterium]|jgi:glycerol-3-phosphate acyltransferase PlsY
MERGPRPEYRAGYMPTPADPTAAMPLWGALLASYFLGAVPFGLLVVRLVKGLDLRTVGSGNIGATNAMRVLGKPLGTFVFLLDCLKGYVPAVWLGSLAAGPDSGLVPAILCATAAVFGHCFPVYLGFKGGKGVATASGALLALEPLVFVAGGLVWLVVLKTTRYVGLASVLMGLTFPIAAYLRRPDDPALLKAMFGLAALILVRHRANIQRLLRGEEIRTGQTADSETPPSN